MKKRTKMDYSMTRKQRKNNSHSESIKEPEQPQISEEERVAEEERKALKRSKRNKILSVAVISVSIVLCVALIASAIIVPLVINYNKRPEGNPIAKIYLSGLEENKETVLEFELFLDKAPIATTNFIFLAKTGFYNNTVINDVQGNLSRFSGYEKLRDEDIYYERINHRATNAEFARSVNKYFKKYNIDYFLGIEDKKYEEIQIFNYRLRKENNGSSTINSEKIYLGDLMFFYGSSSTTMMMATGDNPKLSAQKQNPSQTATFTNATVFGKFNNEETKQKLQLLNDVETKEISATYWRNPLSEIVITKIEITNLFEKEWKQILNKTGIDVYLESGLDPEYDSYTASGHTYSNYCSYY